MAFKLGDLVIDRIISGVGEDHEGKLLYNLTNIQEGSIEITADSVDATDGTGAIIKTFYRAKQGTLTLTNATISLPILEQTSGSKADKAEENPFDMPHIITTATASGIKLVGISDDGSSNNIRVYAVNTNGTLGAEYTSSMYNVTSKTGDMDCSTMTITPQGPQDDKDVMWLIKYDRNVSENAIRIYNRSDAFPKSHKLTLKVLVCDPCETDTVIGAYVVLPNFQPSPEVSFTFSTDTTIDFTGKLATSYCGTQKVLYEIFVAQDDVEEAA